MTFYKLHGAGNDFIFFINEQPQPERAAELCHRETGIGADGVVWLKHLGDNKFYWDFYNSDGSSAEMCGNAARCAMRFAQIKFSLSSMELQTRAGKVTGKTAGGDVEVSFDIGQAPIQEIAHPVGADFSNGYFLNTGVPHCVIPAAHPFELKPRAKELAPHIKNKSFGSGGSNLTFADFKSRPIQTVSLERGVEDFTLACGTGVIATAKVYQQLYKTNEPLQLQTPGGIFTVKFEGLRATLTGPAVFVYEGKISWPA